MIGICILPIEGVLSQVANLKTSQPTRWARSLYDSLHHEYRMIAFTQSDPDLANWWLQREMLRDWAAVMQQPDYSVSYSDWKVRQTEDFLSEGWEMGVFIDVDPDPVTRIARMGVMTMLLCHPLGKPGWKDPNEAPRPWVEVVDTI